MIWKLYGSTRTRFCSYLASHHRRYCDFPLLEMELSSVVKKLNAFAPTTLAGSWDNVGLLIEPTSPHIVNSILLTNDLTETVMSEALDKKVNMILSYHPPIFMPLKRLTQRTWKERIVIKCTENRIALYSPHTCFDAIKGGVNDWMLKPFDGSSEVIEQVDSKCFATSGGYKVDVAFPESDEKLKLLQSDILKIPGVTLMNKNSFENGTSQFTRISINCTQKALPKVVALTQLDEEVALSTEIISLTKPPIPANGPGRLLKLKSPMVLGEVLEKVKSHFGLNNVRLADAVGIDQEKPVKKIAVCAGSGSSVLRGVDADVYITGEMTHHEVLDATHRGIHVILCEHSNTERGFLAVFKDTLTDMFSNKIDVIISSEDRDPLRIV